MKKTYLIGTDIGTSACKTALFSPDGSVVADSSREYPLTHPHPGWAEQDPRDWYSAAALSIRECIEKSGVDPADIAGVGIDGQSWSAIAVDRDGNVLCPDPIWMDTRASDICDRLNREFGRDMLMKLCGNPLTPQYATGKILWYKENLPEIFPKIYKILQSNSYIAYRLTGKMTTEPSEGYGFHCFDMRNCRWDGDMARMLGIPEGFLPDIYPCHGIIGGVTDAAAAECGLLAGTPVVAGAVDAACAPIGAGCIADGDTQEQGGQSGGMSICTSVFAPDPRLILCASVIPGQYLVQGGTVGGGSVMRWSSKEFGDFERIEEQKGGQRVLAQFDGMAEKINPGCDGLIFLPYMNGERTPIWDPDAKGVFYGIDFSKTKGHFVRALMEGVAYSLRHNLDTAAKSGSHVSVLRATGGAANSRFWTQLKADVTGIPVTVPGSDNATGLGAAILAGVGTGVYSGFGEAVSMTVGEKRRHDPDPGLFGIYTRNYNAYLELYERTKGLKI